MFPCLPVLYDLAARNAIDFRVDDRHETVMLEHYFVKFRLPWLDIIL
jgi:hypothetical protein